MATPQNRVEVDDGLPRIAERGTLASVGTGGHDVFISYSVLDAASAAVACATLEEQGLRCWMAPRDVTPGAIYSEELLDAIRTAQLVLLMLSPSSNRSSQVLREVERAVSRDVPILPVRIEDVAPSASLEYFVSANHWLDAFPPPLSDHLRALVDAVVRAVSALSPTRRGEPTGADAADPEQLSGAGHPSNLPPPVTYFTGREEMLGRLGSALDEYRRVVLSGLPGVGKSTLAAAYAHRHAQQYTATLWVSAGGEEKLGSDLAGLADILHLPGAAERDQLAKIAAVQEWLQTKSGWLLIIDNADEPGEIKRLLPSTLEGHVVVTTRASTGGGLGHRLAVTALSPAVGARMLLRRASLPESRGGDAGEVPGDSSVVQIAEKLGGLPLAIEQAAAFIEQAHISPGEYLEMYKAEGAHLLVTSVTEAASVTLTFSLAFDRLATASPAAADAIRLCAYLAPDAVPEELLVDAAFIGGDFAEAVSSRVGLAALVGTACAHSLVDRDPDTRTLRIHRLVQSVLINSLSSDERSLWLARSTDALSAGFPIPDFTNWDMCERRVPHVFSVADHLAEDQLDLPSAVNLFARTSAYLNQRGRAAPALALAYRAVELADRVLSDTDIDMAWALHTLASQQQSAGQWDEAEPVARRAVAIAEHHEADDPRSLIFSLHSLARLCRETGRPEEAEQHLRRALALGKATFGPDSPRLSWSLNGLGDLYAAQGRREEALPLLRQALELRLAHYGPDHPEVAYTQFALGEVLRCLGRNKEAEAMLLGSLETAHKILGAHHPALARVYSSYAKLLGQTGRRSEARAARAHAAAITSD